MSNYQRESVMSWEAETVLVISFHCQMYFRYIEFSFQKDIVNFYSSLAPDENAFVPLHLYIVL